ncbi:hypothetical protein HPB47_002821 [Ixodes persulcatus]|uniref:Uncharacterized protein n=1 Tax=Ixodes persulcatus TaxID=34615 RepID=A0AC60PK53_IXOPE|nr:hypothetical protein HPB47_002821 [Ixodes persulcatus]
MYAPLSGDRLAKEPVLPPDPDQRASTECVLGDGLSMSNRIPADKVSRRREPSALAEGDPSERLRDPDCVLGSHLGSGTERVINTGIDLCLELGVHALGPTRPRAAERDR